MTEIRYFLMLYVRSGRLIWRQIMIFQKGSKKKPKKHVERAADKPEVSHENVLPEKTTGLQRLRAALNVKTPVLDWEEDDRFAKYRNGK